jgi:tetratricopeptide (TPR) repeat protein
VQVEIITSWTGELANALQRSLRMTNESFAAQLGASPRTVAYWKKRPDMVPQPAMQRSLDATLSSAPERVKAQFAILSHESPRTPQSPLDGVAGIPFESMTSHTWTREDSQALAASFDDALSAPIVDEIERLAHVWLISEAPQAIELAQGRRIGPSLIEAVEHRVIQLRRADDFITGTTSHELIRSELKATTGLLAEAELDDDQARRLLTAVGELAQLGAWVAADAGLLEEATKYVRGGVLAARAAGDEPLAANVLSTYSYQVANNANPNDAVVLARTAYRGGERNATPITRTLLLERVAWASAKTGDLRSCERALGEVEDIFSAGPRDNDPDWVYWMNREEVDVMAGRCYTELGKPGKAVALLTDAIGNYDQTLIRENALYLSWLAEDFVQLHDLDQASDLGIHMAQLVSRTKSARAKNRLDHVAALLTPNQASAPVKEFLDAYSSVVVDGS